MNMKKHSHIQRNRGAAILASTIILMIITLLVAVSVQYLGLGELIMSYSDEQGERAYELAQSCENDSLLNIKQNITYTGTTTTQFTNGACTTVVTGSSAAKSIVSAATYGQATRKIKVDITISSGDISIIGWTEVTS